MEQIIMNKIDDGCLPTFSKYIKDQLIGAIVKFVKTGDSSSFSDDFNARKIIDEVGVVNFKQALLEHVVKLNAAFNIVNTRLIVDYNKDYTKHTVGETELRMYETLSLSVTDVFNTNAIRDALLMLEKDGVVLYNLVKSFVMFRYEKAEKAKLDTEYIKDEEHKQMIWKIEEHFKKLSS